MEEKMTEHNKKRVHWLLYPFWLIWRLVIWIIEATGRLIGAILGLVITILGIILTITVVGAIIGVPLIILGIMLMVRSIF
jgi:hypothetical protein